MNKLIFLVTTLLFQTSCDSDRNIKFEQFEDIEYKYDYAAETIAGSISLGHFIYVRDVDQIQEEKIKAFCLHYVSKNPSVSTVWLLNKYTRKKTEKKHLKYRVYFKGKGDSLQIKRFDKY